ncbi:MAG: ROK family protein [Bacteroidota bacterium]|nr:ROK family protein [Bacteroidota bacterium]
MSKAVIGVDLGGTRIKATVLDTEGQLLHQQYLPTNDSNEALWKQSVLNAVNELAVKLNASDFVVGISAPGIPNEENSAIAYMPGRLEGLQNFNWSSFLQHPTWIVNDTIAALIAEAKVGAAKDKKNVVLLTLGTGVGGAILIDGKPYRGAFQKAGHIGHMVIDNESEPDITGMPGSLENAIGNCTVQQRSLGKFRDTYALLEAYRKGDHFARWVWLTSVQKLALGIASLANILSPEYIILGGGITEADKDLFDPLESFLDLYEWRVGGKKAIVVKAQLGDMAGAVGAAYFALLKEDSSK